MLEHFIWVDYAILGIVGLSVLVSLWRGFMREAIALAAWVIAFFVALNFSDRVAGHLVEYISVPSVRQAAGFGLAFVGTLFVGGVVNLVVGQIVDSTGLGATDRLLGVVFGVLRGVLIVAILVLLAGMTPVVNDPWWHQSQFLPHFQALALQLRALLPPGVADAVHFP